jgi:hypothetical protein
VNGTAAAPAPAQSTPITVPDDVAEVLTEGAGTKNRNAAQSFARAQQALAAGDYSKAHDALEKLMRGDGEDVLDPDQLQATENVRDQLGFLSDMQKAGIRADYPPTEAQLVSYFKTLKNNPAAARQAFESYAQSFHVHPANVRGADSDIRYSNVKVKQGDAEYITDAPQSWSDVSKRPARGYQYASRQMNDCQGYAYIAQDLLGAAGFKLVHHIAASTGENSGHAMAVFTHPKEKGYTLTSDDDTFQGTNEKELAKQAYKKLNVKDESGHERFFVGKTEADAEINLAAKKHEL